MKNCKAFQDNSRRIQWAKIRDSILVDAFLVSIFAPVHLEHASHKGEKESPLIGNVKATLGKYEDPFLDYFDARTEQEGEKPWIEGETDCIKRFVDS
jgi:hypothetical protein